MVYFWILGSVGLVVYTIWKFWIYRDVKNDIIVDTEQSELDSDGEVGYERNLRSRISNNNDMKGDGLHQRGRVNNNNAKGDGNLHKRGKTKNGHSVL